ncbi:MAG TPA: cytochrome c [Candidatus Acidoferrum sp.]|nr:cytochrome c [Candidatus Acidoferrum sp.]
MRKRYLLALVVAATIGATLLAGAQEQASSTSVSSVLPPAKATAGTDAAMTAKPAAGSKPAPPINPELSPRIEGEKRFHANCGRCHAAPQKFPARMMATIIRHMRVRATITDEDMRLILKYMTQ